MLEGGQFDPKSMLFIVQLGSYACFFIWAFGMDYWVTWKKEEF